MAQNEIKREFSFVRFSFTHFSFKQIDPTFFLTTGLQQTCEDSPVLKEKYKGEPLSWLQLKPQIYAAYLAKWSEKEMKFSPSLFLRFLLCGWFAFTCKRFFFLSFLELKKEFDTKVEENQSYQATIEGNFSHNMSKFWTKTNLQGTYFFFHCPLNRNKI